MENTLGALIEKHRPDDWDGWNYQTFSPTGYDDLLMISVWYSYEDGHTVRKEIPVVENPDDQVHTVTDR